VNIQLASTGKCMLERQIERYFCEAIAAAGGVAEKVESRSARGFFDRLAVLPGGRVIFAEIKKPKGGVVAAHQRERHERYRSLGAEVVLIKTFADVDRLLGLVDPARAAGVQKTVTRISQ
jgi:hypothetical protein